MNDVSNLAINGFIKKENLFSKDELMEMSKSVDILLQSTKAVNESSTAFFWNDEIIFPFFKLIKNKVNFLKDYFQNDFIYNRSWVRTSYSTYKGNSWHQDTSLNIIPNPIIIGIPLQDLTKDNGRLRFVPNTQTLPHPTFNINNILNEVSFDMKKGDAIFFLNSVWHRGGENTTNKVRNVIYCEFVSTKSFQADFSLDDYQRSQTKLFIMPQQKNSKISKV